MTLKSTIPNLHRALMRIPDPASQQIAVVVQGAAFRRAAVDEGDMRDTIRIEAPQTPGVRVVSVGGVTGGEAGKFVDYAAHVEYGTDKAPAQPFMTPAAEIGKQEAPGIVADLLRDATK